MQDEEEEGIERWYDEVYDEVVLLTDESAFRARESIMTLLVGR